MATNAENAAALRAAIASGVKSTTVDGVTVTYQDTSQMLDALALFERRGEVDGGSVPIKTVALSLSKGLCA